MPISIKTQKIPPQAVLEKKKAEKKLRKQAAKAEKRAARKRREAAAESIIFGSDLFEPIAKKEKEIVIRFGERFTHNRTRISLDGKFAFRQTNEFYFELFYLTEPIKDYEDDLVIEPSSKYWLFDKLTIEELEEVAVKICRAEYAEEKQKLLADIVKMEKERQAELDKADDEFLKDQEQEENEILSTEVSQPNDSSVSNESSRLSSEEQKRSENVEEKKKEGIFTPTFKKKESSVEGRNIFIPVFRKAN